jgi:hypothetical protein
VPVRDPGSKLPQALDAFAVLVEDADGALRRIAGG